MQTQLALLFFLLLAGQAFTGQITLQGDRTILSGTSPQYVAKVNWPPITEEFPVVIDFTLDTPTPVHARIYEHSYTRLSRHFRTGPSTFRPTFKGVPAGNYSMKITAMVALGMDLIVLGFRTVPLTVTDDLADFYQITGKQNILHQAPDNTYLPGRPVQFSADLRLPSSVLTDPTTRLEYSWSLTGPHWNPMTTAGVHGNSSFTHRFTAFGLYTVSVEIVAKMGEVIKKGTLRDIVHIVSHLE